MVEEDKKLNKGVIVKNKKQKIRKDAKDLVHKELYKIYYKTSIIIYSMDMLDIHFGLKFFIIQL